MSRVTDEHVSEARRAYQRAANAPGRGLDDKLRAALEAYEAARASVSVTNDPRVVELVAAVRSIEPVLQLITGAQLLKAGVDVTAYMRLLDAVTALANLEKKE